MVPTPEDRGGEALVSDVMTRSVAVVRDTDSLAFASQVLLWRAIRHLPILDAEDKIVGILSDRDLLPHVIEGPAGSLPVSEFMSSPVETVEAGVLLSEASATLSVARVDALPVLEQGKLVGILTTSDILAERGRLLRRSHSHATPRAVDVMRRRVTAAHPGDSLASAITKLLDADVRHLPVVDDDFRVVGILSDRDVRTAVGDPRTSLAADGGDGPLEEIMVDSVMTHNPVTVDSASSVVEVADILVDERIGAVPVVRDDDTLVGIVSYVDVLSHFVGRR